MMRRTPIRRSSSINRRASQANGVNRDAELEARATRTIAGAVTRPATIVAASSSPAVLKHEYVRSAALIKAYRLIPCQHCGRDDGTVCCAHSNWGFGRGGSIKADDNRGASLCAACHVPVLDQGSKLSRAERQSMWWDTHVKSVRLLLKHGLWPTDVPVPDISSPPW